MYQALSSGGKYPLPATNTEVKCSSSIYYNNLRICSSLACIYRVMDARGKFGEHKKYIRVAQGPGESNSNFLSALQTSQVHS